MQIQTSYEQSNYGKLYIVPTPIGNLEDMTFRAIRILKKVQVIAAEDTRHSQKLLNHFEISNRLLSYHEHNERERTNQLIGRLKKGENVALISDAGMPAISDPGHYLITESIKHNIPLIVLPGANAALSALIGSGLPTNEFLFYGFLPRKKQERQEELTRLKHNKATLIFYESPYRIKETLQVIETSFGNRPVSLVRELTKVHEQYIRGSAAEVVQFLEKHTPRGEYVLVVEGATGETTEETWWSTLSINEHVTHYEKIQRLPHKEALRRVAIDRRMSRRDIYKEVHIDK